MRVAPFINHWFSLYPKGRHPKSEEYYQLSLSFLFTLHRLVGLLAVYLHT